jgi:FO synthase
MGIMLETTSRRLLGKGMAHDNAPDKDPAVRLKTIENAGKLRIPFTTGVLIGIGETFAERVDTLCAIRDVHERYGHIQEVIIQNFRAKADIPMHAHPEPTLLDFLRTIAVARIILGGEMNVQAPPESDAGAVSTADYGWHQRLGWDLAADHRLHQSRGPMAADSYAQACVGRTWLALTSASDGVPRVHRAQASVHG